MVPSSRISSILTVFFSTIDRIRFGKVTARVTATAGDNVPSEKEYIGRNGKIVGYWAYGMFDPRGSFPTSKKYNRY